MSVRINVFGGPGVGKTTTAYALAYDLSSRGLPVIYVSELPKEWAMFGRRPTPTDQLFINAEQFRREELALRNGYIVVTDSPVLLTAVYGEFYGGEESVVEALRIKTRLLDRLYPKVFNLFLERRTDVYDCRGRFQELEEAVILDELVKSSVKDWYGEENVSDFLLPGIEEVSRFIEEKVLPYV